MALRSANDALYDHQTYTGYHELAANVIQVGMGYHGRWQINCVERKGKGKGRPATMETVEMKTLGLQGGIFVNAGWILSPCGKFWAQMLGLTPEYLYQKAGGVSGCVKKCKHRPRHLRDKSR